MQPLKTFIALLACGIVYFLCSGGSARAQSATSLVDAGTQDAIRAGDDGRAMTVQEADAFIWHVFSESEFMRYETATQVYLWLLEQVDQPLTTEEQSILRKPLRLLSMIMPASEQAETRLADALTRDDLGTLTPGLGERLTMWWRRRDPLPATTSNERIEEHLTRVAFASHKYRRDDDVRGFDDRGEIYIRLGKPSRSKTITLRTAAL